MAQLRQKTAQSFVNYGLTVGVLAILITLAAGWYASSSSVTMVDRSELQQTADSLQSYAAESYLVASQYAAQRAPDNYTEVSAQKLHAAVSSLAEQLEEQQVPASLHKQAGTITDQADELDTALAELSHLPQTGRARQLANHISDIQQKTGDIL